MYYPYFRGKQYELIVIKENAELLSYSNFIPIIEPVKLVISGLIRTMDSIKSSEGSLILIVNPINGDFKGDATELTRILVEMYDDYHDFIPGILLGDDIDIQHVESIVEDYPGRKIALIHSGYSNVRDILSLIDNHVENEFINIFLEQYCGRLYRNHFLGTNESVLIRDGFIKRSANRLHPESEFFSDLHITYADEGVTGFGDFLIVGDEYSETGGPAYSVAIHITYRDVDNDNSLYLFHFKSDRNNTPADPAGKFLEALSKLIIELDNPETMLTHTEVMDEFRSLYNREHFPGLGYLKKMMMQHHLELMATLL